MNIWLWCLIGVVGFYLVGAIIYSLIYHDKVFAPYKQCFFLWWLAWSAELYGWVYEWWDEWRLRRWRGKEGYSTLDDPCPMKEATNDRDK